MPRFTLGLHQVFEKDVNVQVCGYNQREFIGLGYFHSCILILHKIHPIWGWLIIVFRHMLGQVLEKLTSCETWWIKIVQWELWCILNYVYLAHYINIIFTSFPKTLNTIIPPKQNDGCVFKNFKFSFKKYFEILDVVMIADSLVTFLFFCLGVQTSDSVIKC